jgi:hypothetical protein
MLWIVSNSAGRTIRPPTENLWLPSAFDNPQAAATVTLE